LIFLFFFCIALLPKVPSNKFVGLKQIKFALIDGRKVERSWPDTKADKADKAVRFVFQCSLVLCILDHSEMNSYIQWSQMSLY